MNDGAVGKGGNAQNPIRRPHPMNPTGRRPRRLRRTKSKDAEPFEFSEAFFGEEEGGGKSVGVHGGQVSLRATAYAIHRHRVGIGNRPTMTSEEGL